MQIEEDGGTVEDFKIAKSSMLKQIKGNEEKAFLTN